MRQNQPCFVVHILEQARIALDAVRVSSYRGAPLLLSPQNYAHMAGVAVFAAMMDALAKIRPNVPFDGAVDCGDAAGYAMAAMRSGIRGIIVNLEDAPLKRVESMAKQLNCTVHDPSIYNGSILDLGLADDPVAACKTYITNFANEDAGTRS